MVILDTQSLPFSVSVAISEITTATELEATLPNARFNFR
jgi:hypothetical protein